MKTCSCCGQTRPLTDFGLKKHKSGNIHPRGTCKPCINDKYRDAAKQRMARRREEFPDAHRAAVAKWKRANPQAKLEMDRRARAKGTWREGLTPEQIQEGLALRAARVKLIALLRRRVRNLSRQATTTGPNFCWIWNKPGMSSAWAFRTRYRLDPEFAVRQRLRASARRLIRRDKVGDLVRAAICRGGTSPKAEAMLGYPLSELVAHLERQFTKGMTWDAFRNGGIHIDHIIPLSSFDLTDEAEWRAAWALTNLRPLWAAENIRKSNRVLHLV